MAPKRATRGRGRAGDDQVLDDLRARRVHALPLRRQRHDVPLHPSEQRPDARERQSRHLRPRGRVCVRDEKRGARRPPASRSRSSATRATRTGSGPTSISRCTRTDGAATDPFPYLKKAKRLLVAAPSAGGAFTLKLQGTVVTTDAARARPEGGHAAGVAVPPEGDEGREDGDPGRAVRRRHRDDARRCPAARVRRSPCGRSPLFRRSKR